MRTLKLFLLLILTVSVLAPSAWSSHSAAPTVPKWDPIAELTFDKKMTIKDGNIKIEEKHINGPGSKQMTVYRFFFQGKPIFDLNQDGKYSYLERLWTVDLDKNGFKEFIIRARNARDKSSPCYGIIFFQIMPGVFKRLDFETYRLGAGNFKDLFGDGKSEVIIRSAHAAQTKNRAGQGFLVSSVYRVTNLSLKRAEFGEVAFPRFFPQTPKLSDRQKRGIYSLLPKYIQSKYL